MNKKFDDTKMVEEVYTVAKKTKGEGEAKGAAIEKALNLMTMLASQIDVLLRKALNNMEKFTALFERLKEIGAAALETPAHAYATYTPARPYSPGGGFNPSYDR